MNKQRVKEKKRFGKGIKQIEYRHDRLAAQNAKKKKLTHKTAKAETVTIRRSQRVCKESITKCSQKCCVSYHYYIEALPSVS